MGLKNYLKRVKIVFLKVCGTEERLGVTFFLPFPSLRFLYIFLFILLINFFPIYFLYIFLYIRVLLQEPVCKPESKILKRLKKK